jgi:hypothetical protein
MEPKQVTLGTIGGGAADELFVDALAKVLDNVQDPNTKATDTREIVLKFKLTTDEERKVGKIEVSCATKLAGVRGMAVAVYLGTADGVNVAVESPRQEDLFPTAKSLLKAAGVKE